MKKASSRRGGDARADSQAAPYASVRRLVRLFVLEQAPQAVVQSTDASKKGSARNQEVRRSRRLLAEAGEQASDADVSPFERRGWTLRSVDLPAAGNRHRSSPPSSSRGIKNIALRRRSMTMTSARIARPRRARGRCRAGARDGPARLGSGRRRRRDRRQESDDDGSPPSSGSSTTTFGSGASPAASLPPGGQDGADLGVRRVRPFAVGSVAASRLLRQIGGSDRALHVELAERRRGGGPRTCPRARRSRGTGGTRGRGARGGR